MDRRRVVFGSGVTLAGLAPAVLNAQGGRAKRLGVLVVVRPNRPPVVASAMEARGWEIGRDLVIIPRFGDGSLSSLPLLARELVAEGVDVILAIGDASAEALAKATSSIPIVMQGYAPVEFGLAKSLARPGGNVTGVMYQGLDSAGKNLDLLRALQPGLQRVGFSMVTTSQVSKVLLQRWVEAASHNGISVTSVPYPVALADLDDMLTAAERERVQALHVGVNYVLEGAGWQKIRAWAVRNRVVTVAPPDAPPEFRQMTLGTGTPMEHFNKLYYDLVDRVLRGANPAETPIQRPTYFAIVIHRGQLREMGLSVPQAVLIQATEVID
jgi:putative tryptophan/tyrosine transport system substrate-binding protein